MADAHADRRAHTPWAHRASPQRGFDAPLLFGATSTRPGQGPRWEGDMDERPYNTAWLLDREGAVVGTYDKVVLLLFGEYVPFARYAPFIYRWIPAAGNLEPGTELKVIEADLWDKGPLRFGILICYEGILASFARPLQAQRPHAIFNLTNDDWFGESAERYLHFALTIPRAIEHRVPVVRPTLTGVSAVVDPVGRVVAQTRPTEPEYFVQSIPLMQSSTVYGVIGDAFGWLCVLLGGLWFLWGRWRRR